MKNISNNSLSPKSNNETEYIKLLFNDFKTALKRIYNTNGK